MLAAERRARTTGLLVRKGGRPMVKDAATHLEPAPGVVPRAHRALLPVLTFVGVTLFEIVRVGLGALREDTPGLGLADVLSLQGVTDLMGSGDSTRALLVGSTSGFVLSLLLAFAAGLRGEVVRAAWTTLRSTGIAIAILYLAWMIGAACDTLGTAPYLTALLGDHLAPELLPAILFLTGAVVAFSTGSSWSTMSILLPLVVGLAFNLGETTELGGRLLLAMSIGAVLEGAIFGDHCSPISDTTVLSSTAAASDHIDHVRTQVPYALTGMLVALSVGYLPCAFVGSHPALSLLLGAALILMVVAALGRKSDVPPPGPTSTSTST
jgi:Na+/H+ antiporter NhaC